MSASTSSNPSSLTTASSVPLPSERLRNLPVYVFAELETFKAEAAARGMDLIDLGMGNPDCPTPQPIVDAIVRGVQDPGNHRYPNFWGKPEFRQAVHHFLERRYDVSGLNPETDIMPLIGSKEGIAHLSFAYAESAAMSIVFSPYYPVHSRATWLAGGQVYHCAMTADNQYLPDPESIPADVVDRARLMFVNYPNNPTAATAPPEYFEKLIAFCKKHRIVLVSDLAYGEIAYDDYRPPSILSVPGARDVAVEFHSFSKSFNMAGWRMGFAAGNPEAIRALFDVKSNLDYGLCPAVQDGGIEALTHAETYLPPIVETYRRRRNLLVDGFRALGWQLEPPKATMYVWLRVPQGHASAHEWCRYLINTTGVVITPGTAFGEAGEGWFRISLVSPEPVLQQALQRLQDQGIRFA